MKEKSVKYSIVIPVYNSEEILKTTIERTVKFLKTLKAPYELILVNDRSPDNSWTIIEQMSKKNKSIVGIKLLKNYGQHTAVYCGLEVARGEFVISMDDDLQNPPEEIIHLIKKIKEGHDLVFGKFAQKRHSLFRILGSRVVGYLNTKIFNKPSGLTLTNFRIIHRSVIDRLKNYKTKYPYIPGLLLLHSHNPGNVEVEHHARSVGKSNYSLIKIAELVARLLFNYTTYPLKMISFIGFLISFLSFVIGLFYVFWHLFHSITIPGWTTIIVMLSFFQGITLLLLGMIGEYIGRIISDNSSITSYHIQQTINLNE